MEKKGRDIATRAELDHWIEDRKKDLPVPENNHPKPSWMENPEDPNRLHMRMRKRRVRYLTNRLDGATREMEREFDQNS